MPRTGFEPASHGFHFSNNDIRWSFGPVSRTQLCGGMSFASLDYYYYRTPIPPDRSPPAEGTPLHRFIYTRQMHAHEFALPRLSRDIPEAGENAFSRGVSSSGQFGRLVRQIDEGRPVPILMVSRRSALSVGSHWTLAIGYEMADHASFGSDACQKIYIYDNAYPDEVCELVPQFMQGVFQQVRSGVAYRTIFADDEYTAMHPATVLNEPSVADLIPALLGGTSPGNQNF